MSADRNPSKAKPKTFNQQDFLVKRQVTWWLVQAKKVLLDLAFPFAKNVLHKLATKATSTVLNKFERKISGKVVARAEK